MKITKFSAIATLKVQSMWTKKKCKHGSTISSILSTTSILNHFLVLCHVSVVSTHTNNHASSSHSTSNMLRVYVTRRKIIEFSSIRNVQPTNEKHSWRLSLPTLNSTKTVHSVAQCLPRIQVSK